MDAVSGVTTRSVTKRLASRSSVTFGRRVKKKQQQKKIHSVCVCEMKKKTPKKVFKPRPGPFQRLCVFSGVWLNSNQMKKIM